MKRFIKTLEVVVFRPFMILAMVAAIVLEIITLFITFPIHLLRVVIVHGVDDAKEELEDVIEEIKDLL